MAAILPRPVVAKIRTLGLETVDDAEDLLHLAAAVDELYLFGLIDGP